MNDSTDHNPDDVQPGGGDSTDNAPGEPDKDCYNSDEDCQGEAV